MTMYRVRPDGKRSLRRRYGAAVLAAAWSLAALAFGTPVSPLRNAEVDHARHHGRPGATSGVMSLDVYSGSPGELHLLLGRRDEDRERTLWYQVSRDGGTTWSSLLRVDVKAPSPQTFRRGNDAQIASSGGTLLAVWTGQGTGWGGTGPLVTAVSRDGGRSWRRGANPSDSTSTATHSFIDLAADATGFRLAWIDSRDKAPGLRYAWSADPASSWSANVTVDAQTCDCCWNTMVTAGKEVLLLYRGHSPRDMALASSETGTAWRRLGPVGAFNWKIDACPETGGALAVTKSRTVHALAWTGTERVLGLHHLQSVDAGRTWSNPRRLGGPDARHADLAAAPDGSLLAVWDDVADFAVRAAMSRDSGNTWSSPSVLNSPSARASHPRAVAVGNGYRVFWTEMPRDGSVVDWKTVAVPAR
jgi:hypothetical protein